MLQKRMGMGLAAGMAFAVMLSAAGCGAESQVSYRVIEDGTAGTQVESGDVSEEEAEVTEMENLEEKEDTISQLEE